jgi:hypothetical protein
MKTLRLSLTLLLCIGFLFSVSSCMVFVSKDNGKHKGWNKNSNNPHHRNSTNPGKAGKKH